MLGGGPQTPASSSRPLADGDDATVHLASTVAIFLEEGSSFVHAGRRRAVTERQLEQRVVLRFIPLGDRSSRV